jgi:4a-hydroxytetrahydrobiopterin dehydratase
MPKLNDGEIDAVVADLQGWSREGEMLVATFRRRDWKDALAFVNVVGEEAERRDHHPDVCITGYRNVTIRLTTHSEGGITTRDVNLARWIDDQGSASDRR